MKRLMLTFMLFATMMAGALAQNDAVYVYRNDGKFDAFFKADIDSMIYSHYDADSIYHNEWQAQLVYTADSIYYIPLEVIDSISFTAPEISTVLYCPDDNHPHAIDLGLPSGTKWCCCNVGASSPEEYGGYYAWGETSEKSVYDWDTFAYHSGNGYVNIGSDISGTQYDVAHVRMGAPWCMPTFEQQEELRNYCEHTWTQQNGVNGILVTGPNDGRVFLPAAGFRLESLYDASDGGHYWSSSLVQDDYYNVGAYGLGFDSYDWGWYDCNRDGGLSVRPVCP